MYFYGETGYKNNEISKIKIGERKFVTIDASLSANEVHEKIILNLKKCKLIK